MDTKSKVHHPSRESLTAINDDGSRYIIHPSDAKGRFTLLRRASAYALIVIYAALPLIQIGGYPAVFLDTDAMRFHFVGLTFGPQDLWLAFFLITGLGFGLFYVTALFGRIWCGWACPQTVFLEHVYRRVERWVEGDAIERRRLDGMIWKPERILKRGLKHILFAFISLALAHMFMAYFVSVPGLWQMMGEAPGENWKVFVFVFAAAAGLYFNFAWFREQLCIVVCPYGRLQSALIDEHSVVIGYDAARGEPRGKAKQENVGDCVDCYRCVHVCPTGIDIRQGLQMECIGCTACIDACDSVMTRLKRPKGLIRHDSMEGLAGRSTKFVRPRMVAYTILLLIGASALTFSLQSLKDATITVWRAPGAPYFVDEEVVRNQFLVRVTNTSDEEASYRIEVDREQTKVEIKGVGELFAIEKNGETVRPVIALVPKQEYTGGFALKIRVFDDAEELLLEKPVAFIGPSANLLE